MKKLTRDEMKNVIGGGDENLSENPNSPNCGDGCGSQPLGFCSNVSCGRCVSVNQGPYECIA